MNAATREWSTDHVMKNIWLCLERDFSKHLGPIFQEQRKSMLENDITSFRALSAPSFLNLTPYMAKCLIQVDKFLKRYRFEKDAYTDLELADLSTRKLQANLVRISTPRTIRLTSWTVLQKARCIISDILGEYDLEEHMHLCRFGYNASVGSPFSKSYLDLKLGEGPLTGSPAHISWFIDYLCTDHVLNDLINRRAESEESNVAFEVCNELPQVFVPKAFDKLRDITPNTLIGTFYTYGLGKVLVQRLKTAGLNLNRLQEIHKKIAQLASVNRKFVTADLSVASASICSWHVNCLFPRKWYNVLKYGRISDCTNSGVKYASATFAGMGIGYTFPLQTLVFYGLIQAIAILTTGTTARVSVYGDDLIYPRGLHKYVRSVFTDIGFLLNEEKTFSSEYFRESCGGDFYHGVDVRPVSPSGQYRGCTANAYLAFLYQMVNNLMRKWDSSEIPSTLHWLLREIAASDGQILIIPPDFPDTAGLRVSRPLNEYGWEYPIIRPKYNTQLQSWTFVHYGLSVKDRPVVMQYPYYWDVLRESVVSADTIETRYEGKLPRLKWKSINKKYFVSIPSKRFADCDEFFKAAKFNAATRIVRRRKLGAFVALKGVSKYKKTLSSIAEWISTVQTS